MENNEETEEEHDGDPSFIQNQYYQKLHAIYTNKGEAINIQELFNEDPTRFSKFSITLKTPSDGTILIDYSKNRINSEIMNLLFNLANSKLVLDARYSLFHGESVNFTEKRAVMHIAFRNRSPVSMKVNGNNVMPKISKELQRIKKFYNSVISGVKRGYSGKQITDIVIIGTAGLCLGSQMVIDALKPFCKGLRLHFVCNVDGISLTEVLEQISHEKTLFIIMSRHLNNIETLTNANSTKEWFLEQYLNNEAVPIQFVGICDTKSKQKFIEFGIDSDLIFEMWDWLDDRYAIWSTACLPIILSVGYDNFESFLEGAHYMDVHFKTAEFTKNTPIILAIIAIWYSNFFNSETYALLPYGNCMDKFASYIQQLEMQSNGKSATNYNNIAEYSTSPIVWGECASKYQNSIGQILHQGTRFVPCDLIASALPQRISKSKHYKTVLANFLAQSQALMLGKDAKQVRAELFAEAGLIDPETTQEDVETEKKRNCGLIENDEQEFDPQSFEIIANITKLIPHKVLTGNRPSNSILVRKFTPFILGALIALYEHKIFVQSVIWDINAFDKFGSQLGRDLATNIFSEFSAKEEIDSHDSSTNNLINFIKSSWDGQSALNIQ